MNLFRKLRRLAYAAALLAPLALLAQVSIHPRPKPSPPEEKKTAANIRVDTNMVLVPTMINMMVRHPDFDRYDLSSLRTLIYGGSPMPEALMQFAISKLPTWRFYQIFGMTETGGFATMLRWRDHQLSGPKASRMRSGGQPAPLRQQPPPGPQAARLVTGVWLQVRCRPLGASLLPGFGA